jgi:hypothetical protein
LFAAAAAWYGHVSSATRSRTYFWRKRADAAVDYGLGRTDVRSICCFGHGVFWYGGVVVGVKDTLRRLEHEVPLLVTMEGHFGLLGGGP